MELSRRLQAVADMVTEGYVVADIGTDHGYIPIYLVNTKKNSKVIAMDVREGPLERAQKHVAEQGLEAVVETRLSDGLKALCPGEVDSVVIAGMGGGLIMRILSESKETVRLLKECILQPQSEIEKVRAFLVQEGFFTIQENMVLEDGKYYPMMKLIPRQQGEAVAGWTDMELRYGKELLYTRHPVLKQYLEWETKVKGDILAGLRQQGGERVQTRISELTDELADAKAGLEYMKQ